MAEEAPPELSAAEEHVAEEPVVEEAPAPPTEEANRRLGLTDVDGNIHAASRGSYGTGRVTVALRIERGTDH